MFCPTCGAEYAQKINYCKRCGANMTAPTNTVEVHVPRPRFAAMFWAVSLFGILGLIACFVAFATFVGMGLRGSDVKFPFMLGMLCVFGIAAMLIRQLAKLINVFQEAVRTPKVETQPLPTYQAPPLTAPPEPVSSISEHTTRSFDSVVYLEAEKRRQRE